jgi:hypothetical protein
VIARGAVTLGTAAPIPASHHDGPDLSAADGAGLVPRFREPLLESGAGWRQGERFESCGPHSP